MLRNSNTVAVEINLLYSKAEFMFFCFSVKKTNQTALEWQVKKNCFDVYIKTGSILSFPGWYIVQQLNNRTMDVSDLLPFQDKCYSTLVKSAGPLQNKCMLFHQKYDSKTFCSQSIFP